MMSLTSYEKKLLAHFILQSSREQEKILDEAVADFRTSGPLIIAYRWAMANT